MNYATLGPIVFEPVTGFTAESETLSWEYAEHPLIEGKPDLQFIGEGLTTRTLGMRFHFSFCNPGEQLEGLKTAARQNEPLALVMAHGGRYADKGDYVITELQTTFRQHDPAGRALIIEVEATLKEYISERQISVARPGVRTG